jgi:hypothetical protein
LTAYIFSRASGFVLQLCHITKYPVSANNVPAEKLNPRWRVYVEIPKPARVELKLCEVYVKGLNVTFDRVHADQSNTMACVNLQFIISFNQSEQDGWTDPVALDKLYSHD